MNTPRFCLRGTTLIACLFAGMLLAPVLRADATLTYIGRLDLDDAEHTSDSGETRSEIVKVSRSGVVAGQTRRYPDGAGNGPFGNSAWLADSVGRSVRIGFGGGPNVTVSQSSGIIDLNENGTAIGRSETNSGVVAWMASIARGTTRLDAFSGPSSYVLDLNDEDWLIGYRDTGFNRQAYLAHADGTPVPIGLMDAAHTSSEGHRTTMAVAVNNARYVIGRSSRYADETQDLLPESAWLRYPDGEYWLPAAPASSSRVSHLTESGYFGLAQLGTDGATTLQVAHGPTRSLRAVDAGAQFDRIAENGSAVVSVLETYRGSPIRRMHWLNTASHGTVRLGLTEYLGSPSDDSVDTVVALTESGVVAGHTRARLGNTAAWVADMTGTVTKIGLYGPGYEWSSGGQVGRHHTDVGGATESGLVWGGSARAFNDAENTGGGGIGWVYNIHTGALQTFVFPEDERGYTNSHVDLVLENGTVVGTYMDFSSGLPDPQERVFLWIPGEGLVLLDERIDIAAAAAGFNQGYGPLRHASANGMLIGFGLPTEDDSYSFTGNGIYAVRLGEDGEPPPPPPPGELG